MDPLKQTGIFYFNSAQGHAGGAFPEELKRNWRSRIDPLFAGIFGGLMLVIGLSVALLSGLKGDETVSEQDMIKLQERYAKLVLNKEIPKVEEKAPEPTNLPKQEEAAKAEEVAAAEEAAAEEKRATETVQEKQVRREASSEQRAVKREALKKQLDNVGLFAELTASAVGSGGSGSGKRSVRDLVGNIDASSSLSNVSLSGESFASAKANSYEAGAAGGTGLSSRRGEKTEAGTIGTSQLTSAAAGTLKSEGSVEMSKLENVEGEAAGDASRDMKALQQVLQRYQPRLKKVYEDFLKRNPDASGRLVVKFTIEADGSVSNVTVVSSDIKDTELQRNLVRYIERIKFAPASGKLTIEWPLIFSAS